MDEVVITDELLESGRSKNGGWSKSQIRALGVRFPASGAWPHKWRRGLLGQRVPKTSVEQFLALRNEHLASERLLPLFEDCK